MSVVFQYGSAVSVGLFVAWALLRAWADSQSEEPTR
jgi:hypothetical protein